MTVHYEVKVAIEVPADSDPYTIAEIVSQDVQLAKQITQMIEAKFQEVAAVHRELFEKAAAEYQSNRKN